MTTIHVPPEFPLNRRMRRAVRCGKLRVVRAPGERLPLGEGMAVEARRAVRTFSSPLVCIADSGAEVGGGLGEENGEGSKLQGLLRKFQNRMEEIRKSLVDIGEDAFLKALDEDNIEEAKTAWAALPPNVRKGLEEKRGHMLRLIGDIGLNMGIAGTLPPSPELDYYGRNKKVGVRLCVLFVDIGPIGAPPESSEARNFFSEARPVKELIRQALDFFGESIGVPEAVADAWEGQIRLLESPHFEPDAWLENMSEIDSFVVPDDIPPQVKGRMWEIHSCFFFGNWIAVVALSRCLLEYVIAHRFQDTQEYKKLGGSPKLGDLIEKVVGKHAPQVDRRQMTDIKDSGNRIMHPKGCPDDFEDSAKNCFSRITKVVRELYEARG